MQYGRPIILTLSGATSLVGEYVENFFQHFLPKGEKTHKDVLWYVFAQFFQYRSIYHKT